MNAKSFSISWGALIVPEVSLAGIPLTVNVEDFICVLARYAVNKEAQLYQFPEGPLLVMKLNIGSDGNGGCSFLLKDVDVVNKIKREVPAISIDFKNGKVCAIKVYDFSFSGEKAGDLVYRGRLKEGIGLGSDVSRLLDYTSLDFDESEGWFYTDDNYGLVEVTGWGVPLEVRPEQCITAICIVA